MASSLPNVKIALSNTQEPIDIQVSDDAGNPVDAIQLDLKILSVGGSVLFTDSFTTPPVGGTKIIKPTGTLGYYYYPFGILTNQTDGTGDFLFQWTVMGSGGATVVTVVQNVKVVSPQVFQVIPYLRLMVDKSRKIVDPNNDVFLGYTDSQLVMYLEDGMQVINAYQPETVSGFTIENFPWSDFRHLAIESALICGVMSQQLFAVDTDMPNYTDQGTTFVIAHQPQLASILNQITMRLDKAIPAMKQQFVSTGSIHIAAGPNFRMAQLLQAAPNGSLFRNVFFKG